MTIRLFIEDDIEEMVELLEVCFAETNNSLHQWDSSTVRTRLYSYLDNAVVNIYVYEEEDKILGVCGVMLCPDLININVCRCVEFIWHTDVNLPLRKRFSIMKLLLEKMEDVSKGNILNIGVKPSNSLGRYLLSQGYEMNEVIYFKEVI